MQTQALVQALKAGGYDAAFGGARRDEEKARAKERVYSFRNKQMQWDPKNQRPELWNLYNGKVNKGESIRVFPLSNWTELDVWLYIHREQIPLVPLYFAKPAPVVVRDGPPRGRRRAHALRPARSRRCARSASAPSAATR
jgi:sulfate adenylyltransferase subunit 2